MTVKEKERLKRQWIRLDKRLQELSAKRERIINAIRAIDERFPYITDGWRARKESWDWVYVPPRRKRKHDKVPRC